MTKTPIGIGSLPNEILDGILSLFSTRTLLPLTTTSRRVHDAILIIIHQRLVAAASRADQQIILECYHPSAKFSTPYYNCDYIYTDAFEEQGSDNTEGTCGGLGRLRDLYAHFQPRQPEGDRKVWTARPTGGWLQATLDQVTGRRDGLVSQNVDLESYELFSQLQSIVNVVKPGPNGYFSSSTKISEGLMRVWRDWLADCSRKWTSRSDPPEDKDRHKCLLWASVREDTGLKLRVLEKEGTQSELPRRGGEDPSVGYTLQYEELVVRSSQLLLKLEAAAEREQSRKDVCGLDGVHITGVISRRLIEQNDATHWRPMIRGA